MDKKTRTPATITLARVRRIVRKQRSEREKRLVTYQASRDPRDRILSERVEGGIAACDDLLTALMGRG